MIDIDKLQERGREARITESTQINPSVDIEILNAFERSRPSRLQVKKTPIPVYRCYFIDHDIVATYMSHLLTGEHEMLQEIVRKSLNLHPTIILYVLFENDVVLKEKISASVFAHLLFRFHHRIAKKYIEEERFLF